VGGGYMVAEVGSVLGEGGGGGNGKNGPMKSPARANQPVVHSGVAMAALAWASWTVARLGWRLARGVWVGLGAVMRRAGWRRVADQMAGAAGGVGRPEAGSGERPGVTAGPRQPFGKAPKRGRGVLDTSLPPRVGAVWNVPSMVVGKIAEYLCSAEGDMGGASGLFRLNAPSTMPDLEVASSPREMAFEEMLCWLFPSPAVLNRMRSLQFGLDRLQMAMSRTTDLLWVGGCRLGSSEIDAHEDYWGGLDWQLKNYMRESHVIAMEAEIGRKIFMQQEWGVMCGWWEALFQEAAPHTNTDPMTTDSMQLRTPDQWRSGQPQGPRRGGGGLF
jgi:hypothetical protein